MKRRSAEGKPIRPFFRATCAFATLNLKRRRPRVDALSGGRCRCFGLGVVGSKMCAGQALWLAKDAQLLRLIPVLDKPGCGEGWVFSVSLSQTVAVNRDSWMTCLTCAASVCSSWRSPIKVANSPAPPPTCWSTRDFCQCACRACPASTHALTSYASRALEAEDGP